MSFKKNLLILFIAISCFANGDQYAENGMPPNFIIIYADDMGYSDAGPYGNPLINTPAIDSLARRGQVWTNFYSAASVCSPSRGALLTGKLPARTGLYGNHIAVFFPGSKKGIPHIEKTIAEVFQENNYATGMFGKWHLGDARDYYPTRHGFDEWVGIPYSNDMDWEVEGITLNNIFNVPKEIQAKWGKVAPIIRKRIFAPQIKDWQVPLISSKKLDDSAFEDIEIERPANQILITQRYTDESIRFITESKKSKTPFFLYVSHSMPHVPLFRSHKFVGKSDQGIYGDVIEEIDWSVSQIIDTLEALSLEDNTYVVFTSDNGPWLIYGDHAGTAQPLKQGKGTTFEGGMRVMTFFNGPGIKPREINDLGMQTDIFSTFVNLAGITTTSLPIDSLDLTSSLLRELPSPRKFVPYFKGSELLAFRWMDHKVHYVTQGAYGRDPKREEHKPPILINLLQDIGESNNVANQHPSIVSQIDSIAQEFKKSLSIKPSILDNQFSD